jgi:RNA polymerase sigma-70 factor (ECF subfamily)
MLAMERLSPLERAAFLLHDVFGLELNEVARALDREPSACRKLATRAREHVREARPRFPLSPEHSAEIAQAFYAASRAGDVSALQQLLAKDVVFYSDGGGKSKAATKPILGSSRVERFLLGIARKSGWRPALFYRPTCIDGLPGFITVGLDLTVQTTALAIEAGRITAIYVTRNPDKLRRLPVGEGELDAALGRPLTH